LDLVERKYSEDGEKFLNEAVHNLHSSLNVIWLIRSRRMGCSEHVACMGDIRNTKFVRKCEWKRPFGRPG